MDTGWLKGALFAGMSSNAFKLGTVLTCGWFWPRVGGCSVLYRGYSMDTIDFTNILTVAEANALQISPPNYVQHNGDSTYFYVVRRANNCGDQEHTLSAAVRVSIDSSGNLAEPRPNSVFEVRAEQTDSCKTKLVWYYCPLGHKQEPVGFNVYYDAGTGQIDYENALVTISYKGRKFYCYLSNSLGSDTYLFCIRAEGANGAESGSVHTGIQFDTDNPPAVEILGAEAI
jgi:hypothetical protein